MRAIASLSLTFGLVSIPVKLYSATESSAAIRFKLMSRGGARLRQQYVADADDVGRDATGRSGERPPAMPPQAQAPRVAPAVVIDEPGELENAAAVTDEPDELESAPAPASPAARADAQTGDDAEGDKIGDEQDDDKAARAQPSASRFVERHEMVKGYEFEKGRFVLFTPAELQALQEGARDSIDIVSFIPAGSVDPLFYDKAYLLAPDKRGEKTYSLLLAALHESGRSALAKWSWRSKQTVVEVRPARDGLVLQQLFYADEVRSLDDLPIQLVDVGEAELKLALQLIEQGAEPAYDPTKFVDEEKQRILAAVEQKIAGRHIVATGHEPKPSGQVIDLMAALRASLRAPSAAAPAASRAAGAAKRAAATDEVAPRKAARTARPAAKSTVKSASKAAAAAPARAGKARR